LPEDDAEETASDEVKAEKVWIRCLSPPDSSRQPFAHAPLLLLQKRAKARASEQEYRAAAEALEKAQAELKPSLEKVTEVWRRPLSMVLALIHFLVIRPSSCCPFRQRQDLVQLERMHWPRTQNALTIYLTRMKQWHEEGSAAAEITLEQLQQLQCDDMLRRKAKQIERNDILGRRASHGRIFEHDDHVERIVQESDEAQDAKERASSLSPKGKRARSPFSRVKKWLPGTRSGRSSLVVETSRRDSAALEEEQEREEVESSGGLKHAGGETTCGEDRPRGENLDCTEDASDEEEEETRRAPIRFSIRPKTGAEPANDPWATTAAPHAATLPPPPFSFATAEGTAEPNGHAEPQPNAVAEDVPGILKDDQLPPPPSVFAEAVELPLDDEGEESYEGGSQDEEFDEDEAPPREAPRASSKAASRPSRPDLRQSLRPSSSAPETPDRPAVGSAPMTPSPLSPRVSRGPSLASGLGTRPSSSGSNRARALSTSERPRKSISRISSFSSTVGTTEESLPHPLSASCMYHAFVGK
jgi:hypothetical protein